MSKRALLSLVLIGILAFGLGIGTFAYYSMTLGSVDNTITAASFNFTSWKDNLSAVQDAKFSVDNIQPGQSIMFPFDFSLAGTEVNVSANVAVTTSGTGLFAEGTPIDVKLVYYGHDGNGSYEILSELTDTVVIGKDDVKKGYSYAVIVDWSWGTNDGTDNQWQGLTGDIDVQVIVNQLQDSAVFTKVYVNDSGKSLLIDESNNVLINAKVKYNTANNSVTVYHDNLKGGSYTSSNLGRMGTANGIIQTDGSSATMNIWMPEDIVNQLLD